MIALLINQRLTVNGGRLQHAGRSVSYTHLDVYKRQVIIWSMGNESAYGCTFEEALAWTKSFDPRRLTRYESAQ